MKNLIEVYRENHGYKYDYSLSDFNNLKIKIICPIHGIFEQNKYSHRECGCWKCSVEIRSKSQRLGKEAFVEKSLKIHGDRYDYSLSKYISQKVKVEIICKEHGIFEQFPGNHLRGYNCAKCSGKLLTTDDFIKKCKEKYGEKYDYSLVNYIDSHSKVKIICTLHGIFLQNPSNHLNQKNGCPECFSKNKPSNTNNFIYNSKIAHGDRYDYSLVDYEKAKNTVIIVCKSHGQFSQSPTHHLSGQGCPICKSSKGENEIFKILIKKFIKFKHHLKLEKSRLEFDFYLPELNIAIEYDGIQHFTPVKHFGGIKALKEQKRRDSEKDQYCINNNIKLLRIPYYENVELFLNLNLFNI
jgi:very-short-patch-repair endonuclease